MSLLEAFCLLKLKFKGFGILISYTFKNPDLEIESLHRNN